MNATTLQQIRQLLWLYFWLLILEGALRKWLLPGLSSPLLLVRDPVAVLALWWGWPLLSRRPWRAWLQPLLLIAVVAFLLAITVGHGDILTALFGTRILVLHLPLIFLYAAAFNRKDVNRFAWTLVLISLPMTLLIVAQSSLPSSHILNVAPGGEDTAVFAGALGRFRPPGVFSFITGVAVFYTLSASSLFFLLYATTLSMRTRVICVLAGIALMVALPVSISRSLLAGYLQVLAAGIMALLLSRTRLIPLFSGILALVLAFGVATTIPAFRDTSEAFQARWELAAAAESSDDERLGGGIGVFQKRVLSDFLLPFSESETLPFLGYGIGMGTNVGAQRLSGERTFLIAEGAWQASFGELGLPLGLAFVMWRFALGVWILRLAIREAVQRNPLPLILTGSSLLIVISGATSQPTNLGFLVVSAGLTLAACNIGIDQYRPNYRSVKLKAQPDPDADQLASQP